MMNGYGYGNDQRSMFAFKAAFDWLCSTSKENSFKIKAAEKLI